jgi:hypothetical protein
MPGYYPTWKVRLDVRLEEWSDGALKPKVFPSQLKGIKSARDVLQVSKDPNAPSGVTRYLLSTAAQKTSTHEDQSSADGKTFRVGVVLPRKLTWKANGPRQADQLTVEINQIDFPIDPRCIRSCAVTAFIGCVTPDEYEQGLSGKVRSTFSGSPSDGESLCVVPDSYSDSHGRSRSNLRFLGWVDSWEIEQGENDSSIIKLECRDNSTLLIDQEAAPQLAIDPVKGIDEAFALYLANYPQFAGLSVEYRGPTSKAPTLAEALASTAYRPQIGITPTKTGGATGAQGANANSKITVFDHLSDVAAMIGQILQFEGTNIVIQSARTLTSRKDAPRPSDPYVPRDYLGLHMNHRTMIIGRNVESWKCSRKYSRVVSCTIEVRTYSPKRKKVLVVRYPEKSLQTPKLPGDDRNENRVKVISVAGIESEAILKQIAQTYYEMSGRKELTASFKTWDMGSWGGSNDDPDLLDMRPGDALDLYTHREDGGNEDSIEGVESALLNATKRLERLGFDSKFAKAYCETYRAIGFQTTFLVRGFSVDCSAEEGVSISVDLCNYITVRADTQK